MNTLAMIDALRQAARAHEHSGMSAHIERALAEATLDIARRYGLDPAAIEKKAADLCSFDGGPVIYYP